MRDKFKFPVGINLVELDIKSYIKVFTEETFVVLLEVLYTTATTSV